MKRMTILLSAATLALVPLASHAAKKDRDPFTYGPIAMGLCTCAVTEDVEYTDENEVVQTDGVQYDCSVSWEDVIGAGTEEPDKAAYGASWEVEILEEDAEDPQVLNSEIELDWSMVCAGSDAEVEDAEVGLGTCMVERKAAPFILTNYASQEVTVQAAVKALRTGPTGAVPRNFEKSSSGVCGIDPPTDSAQ